MQARKIGEAGLVSTPIGLGCLAFTGGYGPVSRAESVRTVRHALGIGITMLDIADFYAAGDVERLVGQAIVRRRDGVVIATRGGMRFNSDGRPTELDASPAYLAQACDASLRRLGVNHIDLYYLAGVDPRVPVEESAGQLAGLVQAGKIRYIGLSGVSPNQLRRSHAVHPVSAVAAEYSLWDQRSAADVLHVARELGVGVVACRPLGRGFLTGKITKPDAFGPADYRRSDPRFGPDAFSRSRQLIRAMEQVAADLDIGLARLALAWTLSGSHDVVPVPSTRNLLHLEMNASAVTVQLSATEHDRLTALFPPASVSRRR
jgi:aryl-alcohol dehydrogenase-like predicted oxidoreductase